jgi:hypothetical protein
MIVFALFAMGSVLQVGGKTVGIPLPTALIEYIPVLRNIRTPSRAVVYVYLFLAVATGLAIQWVVCNEKKRLVRRFRSIIVVVMGVLIFVDFYPNNIDSTEVGCPIAYNKIRNDYSETFGVLDLPTSYVNGNRYMMYQMCHEKPIVNATTSRKLKPSLSDYLEHVPSNRQKQQLARSRVKYVVIHKEFISEKDKVDIEAYRKYYHPIYNDQKNVVFQVY